MMNAQTLQTKSLVMELCDACRAHGLPQRFQALKTAPIGASRF